MAAVARHCINGDGGDGVVAVARLGQHAQHGEREAENIDVGPGSVSGQDGTAGHHCQEGFGWRGEGFGGGEE